MLWGPFLISKVSNRFLVRTINFTLIVIRLSCLKNILWVIFSSQKQFDGLRQVLRQTSHCKTALSVLIRAWPTFRNNTKNIVRSNFLSYHSSQEFWLSHWYRGSIKYCFCRRGSDANCFARRWDRHLLLWILAMLSSLYLWGRRAAMMQLTEWRFLRAFCIFGATQHHISPGKALTVRKSQTNHQSFLERVSTT